MKGAGAAGGSGRGAGVSRGVPGGAASAGRAAGAGFARVLPPGAQATEEQVAGEPASDQSERAGTAGTGAAGLGALLALQGVSAGGSAGGPAAPAAAAMRDAAALDGAQSLLDGLRALQRGMLEGTTDPGDLGALADRLATLPQAADPELRAAVAAVALRAAIELARRDAAQGARRTGG